MPSISVEAVLSVASFAVTAYFWFVQSRRERADLRIFQLRSFRASCRKVQGRDGVRRLCLQQVDPCGTLIANNSTRQNSIVMFDCYLKLDGQVLRGDWGYSNNDMPPWNVGPESTIALSLACFFDVPESYEPPDELEFLIEFVTVSGRRFRHVFARTPPQFGAESPPAAQAA